MPSFGYIYYDHYRIEAAVKYFKNGKIGIRQPYDGDRKFQYFDPEGNAITKSEFVKKYLSELNYPRLRPKRKMKSILSNGLSVEILKKQCKSNCVIVRCLIP